MLDPDSADELLASFGKEENEAIESLDFTHSRRHAWNLIKKLSLNKTTKSTT